MKRVNVKLLLILVGGAITSMVTVYFVHGFQVDRNAGLLQKRAIRALEVAGESGEKDDYEKAKRHFRRYLMHRQDDVVQYANFAQCMREIAELPERTPQDVRLAYSALEDAVTKLRSAVFQDTDNQELKERLIESRRTLIDYSMPLTGGSRQVSATVMENLEALGVSKNFSEFDPSTDKTPEPELVVHMATCLARSNQTEAAAEWLEWLVGYDVDNQKFDPEAAVATDEVAAYVLLKGIYLKASRKVEADVVMRTLVELNADSGSAHVERGRYLWDLTTNMADELRQEAIDEVDKALELTPKELNVILTAADYAKTQEQFDRAKELLDVGLREHDDSPHVYRMYADLAVKQQDLKAAMDYVTQGLKNVRLKSDKTLLRWYQAKFQIDEQERLPRAERDMTAVRRTLNTLRDEGYPRPLVDFLTARVQLLEGKAWQAKQQLERLRPLMPQLGNQVNFYLTQCYGILGQSDRQLEAVRRILKVAPGNIAARRVETSALLAMGRREEALSILSGLEAALGKDERIAMLPNLVDSNLKLRVGEQLRLPAEERDWTVVDRIAKKLVAMATSDKAKSAIATNILLQKGDTEQARKRVDESLKEYPDDASVRLLEVILVEQEHGADKALEALAKVQQEFGDTLNLRLQQARLIVVRGGPDATDLMAELEQDLDNLDGEAGNAQQRYLWTMLGEYYLRLQAVEQTRRMWHRVAEADERNADIRFKLFDLARQLGDESGMSEMLSELEHLRGRQSSQWKYAEASRLVWQVRNDAADRDDALALAGKLLKEASQNRPDWQNLVILQAEIATLEGDAKLAIQLLQRALRLGAPNPTMIQRLVEMLVAYGRDNEAEEAMGFLEESWRPAWADKIQATLELKRGNNEKALELATRSVNLETENPKDLMWYAQLSASGGQHEQAEQALRRLLQLSPAATEGWLALAALLVKDGRPEAAEDVLRQAQITLSESQAPLTLGRGYQMLGRPAEAERHYLMALEVDPDNTSLLRTVATFYITINRAAQGHKHLQKILEGAKPNDTKITPNVVWARRAMARLLAASGSYSEYLGALGLIDANVPKDGKMSAADLLLKVSLAVSRPDSASRRSAVRLLESTRDQRSLSGSEKLVLAQLYEKANRWSACQSLMIDVLSQDPDNAQFVATYCEMLLRRGEPRSVAIWLRNLDANSTAAQRIRAQMLVQQGKTQEAVDRVMSTIPRPLPPEQNQVLATTAMLLERLGQLDAAERLLREYYRLDPRAGTVLAGFLGRRGKIDEAFELCDEAMKSLPVVAVMQVALATLARNKGQLDPDSEYHQRIRKWFNKALVEFPDSRALTLQLAEFEDQQDNAVEVVKLYRKFLARTDLASQQRAIVQNNLAYRLSKDGQADEALALVEDAIKHIGPVADLLDTRAMAHLARGDVTRAVADLTMAVSEGGSPEMYFHLALAEYANGNKQEASKALTQAKELGLKQDKLMPTERQRYLKLVKDLGLSPVAADSTDTATPSS